MHASVAAPSSVQFAHALLPSGWARDVRVEMREGRVASVVCNAEPADDAVSYAIGVPAANNVHSHAFQRALAGLTEYRRGAESFWSWRELMYRFLQRLTPEQLEAITAYAYVEMLEAGIARVGEFHYLHHSSDGQPYAHSAELAERVASAAAQTGIGLTLLPVFYAHGGIGGAPPQPSQSRFVNSLDSFEQLVEASRSALASVPFANLGIAAHSLRAVTPDELRVLQQLAPREPFHIHVAEQANEVDAWQEHTGRRPVEWLLQQFDIDERWCLVHATHVDDAEVSQLAQRAATVGLCPITEANLGDGLFPARSFVTAGGRFAVGTDSNVHIDFAGELRLLEYGQRLAQRERNVLSDSQTRSTGATLYAQALAGGARVLRNDIGQLAAGALADFVALDAEHPSMLGRSGDAWLDSWIFAGPRAIKDVWVAGRRVVTAGQHHDRERIAARYREVLLSLLN